MDLNWRPGNEEEKITATVRVMPIDEDNEHDDDMAMEFEYASRDYDIFGDWLNRNPYVGDWELNGNAYSMEGTKSTILKFKALIESKYGPVQFRAYPGGSFKGKIGIEWNYWVDA